jgi:hypothetical protein
MQYPGVVLPPQVKVFSSFLSQGEAQGNFLLRPILHRNACREVTRPCTFLANNPLLSVSLFSSVSLIDGRRSMHSNR